MLELKQLLPTVTWSDQLLQLVLQQIQKDFALQGYGFDTPTDQTNLFLTEVRHQLRRLITDDVHGLSAMLYRIDIPENKVRIAISNSDEEAELVLLKLVVERELKKVEWRLKWSEHSSEI